MTQDCNHRDEPVEVTFDIANPAEPLDFMGLLKAPANSGEALVAAFGWTCPACAARNWTTATVVPGQASLAEWTCSFCSRCLFVRFRGRSAPEWITQHDLVITGEALRRLADDSDSRQSAATQTQAGKSSQRIFAWIAVPALAAVMVLGIYDIRQIQSSHAFGRWWNGGRSLPCYSWLGGQWVGNDSDDRFFFGYMNPTAQEGSYTRVTQSGGSSGIVRFRIVHEQTTQGRLVLEELNSQALLYITRNSDHLVRVTPHDGKPVITTYRHRDHRRDPNQP